MSVERDAMIAELAPIDTLLEELSTRLTNYKGAYRDAVAYDVDAGPVSVSRGTILFITCDPHVLETFIVLRLKQLGHASLFQQARVPFTGPPAGPGLPAAWVAHLTASITTHVP